MVVILGVAAWLRCWGLAFGLPHTLARPDEEVVFAIALRCFERQFNPHFFDWPTLYMYVVGAGDILYFNIGRLAGWFPLEYDFLLSVARNHAPVFLIARGVSATLGVATVWVTYLVGRRLFAPSVALAGAAFLAVAPLHVRDSHFGLPDVAATMLVVTAFYFVVCYAQSGRRKDAWLVGLFAGLAASTKYNAGLMLVPGLWVILRDVRGADAARLRLALLCALTALAAFIAASPYVLLDWRGFLEGLRRISAHLSAGHVTQDSWAWRTHLTSSLWYGLGWPVLATGIVGLATYVWRDRRAGPLFALFPLLYFALIGAGHTAFARYVIPVLPFLCLAAGFVVVDVAAAVTDRSARRFAVPVAIVCLGAVLAAPGLRSAVAMDRLLSRPDNRLVAAAWLRSTYPEGATLHQSGMAYGHVQMPADPVAGDAPFRDVNFNETSGAFETAAGDETPAPRLVVVQEHPLSYARIAPALTQVLTRDYRLVESFHALDSEGVGQAFDLDDAFYVPLAGFGAVSRPGPNLAVYERVAR